VFFNVTLDFSSLVSQLTDPILQISNSVTHSGCKVTTCTFSTKTYHFSTCHLFTAMIANSLDTVMMRMLHPRKRRDVNPFDDIRGAQRKNHEEIMERGNESRD
jgi:hypothetical protein